MAGVNRTAAAGRRALGVALSTALGLGFGTALATGDLAAQASSGTIAAESSEVPLGPLNPERRAFDAVVAIIGDSVILRSTLEREVAARTPPGRALDSEERRDLQTQIVMQMARQEIWVQHGKSIGERAPTEFARLVEEMVDGELKDDLRASGSFTNLDEQFGLLGTSWQDVRRRKRNEILERYARGDVLTKLRQNQGLMVRPADMVAYYQEHPEIFHREASADVAWVSFPIGRDETEAEACARVETARQAWVAEPLTSEELASRFQGTDLGVKADIRQTKNDMRAKFLKDFASQAREGEVSEPIRRGRFFALLRCVAKTDAESLAFHDADVQTRIRLRLALQQNDAWSERVLLRKQQKIYVWPPSLILER